MNRKSYWLALRKDELDGIVPHGLFESREAAIHDSAIYAACRVNSLSLYDTAAKELRSRECFEFRASDVDVWLQIDHVGVENFKATVPAEPSEDEPPLASDVIFDPADDADQPGLTAEDLAELEAAEPDGVGPTDEELAVALEENDIDDSMLNPDLAVEDTDGDLDSKPSLAELARHLRDELAALEKSLP